MPQLNNVLIPQLLFYFRLTIQSRGDGGLCWGISNQILISVPSYLDDVQSVICYHYTSVSCYAIIYNGFGDSGIQRGRYVWLELCTLFGDYATSTPHHSPKWSRTKVPTMCLWREMPQDNFACSCRTASQQTSTLQMISSRTTSVAALFPSALPLHTQPFQEQGYNVVRMRAQHRTSVRSTSLVT